jgi:alanine dehydrogenase
VSAPESSLYLIEAVALAEKGIKADDMGHMVGEKFYMPVGSAGFIKPFSGYLVSEQLAFVKTFSFFPENLLRCGCSTASSMILLFDAETGLPVCLMAGRWVTALTTGASTAVTAAYLARPDASTATILAPGRWDGFTCGH